MNRNQIYSALLGLCMAMIHVGAKAQETLMEVRAESIDGYSDPFVATNEMDGKTLLFIRDPGVLSAFYISADYRLINMSQGPEIPYAYGNFMGVSHQGDLYTLYTANMGYEKFYFTTINAASGKAISGYPDLKLKKEGLVNTFTYQQGFYMLTIKKATSVLVLREFQAGKLIDTKELDFAGAALGEGVTDLYDAFMTSGKSQSAAGSIGGIKPPYAKKVDGLASAPIPTTAHKCKLYQVGSEVYITFDHEGQSTYLVKFDLRSSAKEVMAISSQVQGCPEGSDIESNSHLYDGQLFRAAACADGLTFTITDLASKQEKAAYHAGKDERIGFQNGQITQVGEQTLRATGEDKSLNTAQLLRKITGSDLGIEVTKTDAQYQVKIGGHKVGQVESAMGFGGMINPVSASFPMGNERIAYFQTVLARPSLRHIGDQAATLAKTPFEQISEYLAGLEDYYAEVVFRSGEAIILGYYDQNAGSYILKRFQ